MKIQNIIRLIAFGVVLFIFDSALGADLDLRFNPSNGHYYLIVNQMMSWSAAKDYCESLPGGDGGGTAYLVTITSDQENQFVHELLNNESGWLGASDHDAEGLWEWVTGPEGQSGMVFWDGQEGSSGGIPVDGRYTNWDRNQPNDRDGQDYLAMRAAGGWNDTDENALNQFVCEFNPTTYFTITASAGDNGAIEPLGEPPGLVKVEEGADQTFTIIPDPGYKVDTVRVDDLPGELENNQYTFKNIGQDHKIEVTFVENIHTITAGSGSNGSISPTGSVMVAHDAEKTFTITAAANYQIREVLVDDMPVALTGGQYTFTNVNRDHTISVSFIEINSEPGEEIGENVAGCSTNATADYSKGFKPQDFVLVNTGVDDQEHLVLDTGYAAIDPAKIIIPFTQSVSVTFLYEGAGFKYSDFGWMLAANGSAGTKHEIYQDVNDNDQNGVLDVGPNNNADRFGDTNGDGRIDALDNIKVLGTFEGGTEIVFYLKVDNENQTYYTKTDWNTDTYTSTSGECVGNSIAKIYHLGLPLPSEGSCSLASNWMYSTALDRVNNLFGLHFAENDTATLDIERDKPFSHVIVGAPGNKPNEWILGWEDLKGGGDTDHNDLVFQIERETGGMAQLLSEHAIRPDKEDAYFTGVTVRLYDRMPCSGKTKITYFLSIDNGQNWVEIRAWDEVYSFEPVDGSTDRGDKISSWTPGNPEYTYRSRRIDFAGMGLSGNSLIWKAEFVSQDEACKPELIDLGLDASVATHGYFARSSPVVKANVLYSGYYETPQISWTDKNLRGHLTATRIYDPTEPGATKELKLWDAGESLSLTPPSDRVIYFPNIEVATISNEEIARGDNTTQTFSGQLHHPVLATTLAITDQRETFYDKHIDVLEGNLGGAGTIDRFNGKFTVSFNTAPRVGQPITVNYSYYLAHPALLEFKNDNGIVSNDMLGLDVTFIFPDGYVYDFNEDGHVDQADGQWLVNWVRGYKDGDHIAKEWPLGPIDHSVPAVATPPGVPLWFFGTDITEAERTSYKGFMKDEKISTRPTVVYVGARDGMLHAFDAGNFRHDDNPESAPIEKRGYFLWQNRSAEDCPAYCSDDCSKCPDYGTGDELWAFIPANLIPRLKNNRLRSEDQAYVDASPALADVFINGRWRTVLLAAEGNGGDTVFCLDVTDPVTPSFLWEFAHPELFRSRSSPSVAQIGRILDNGTAKWVAFFVSGKIEDPNLYPSIYMINIADGSKEDKISLTADTGGIGGVPSGQPSIIDSDGNGYIDRIYIGTDKGRMYKVNIPDDPDTQKYNINHCVINTDFTDDDLDNELNSIPENQRYQPIYGSPVVIADNGLTGEGKIHYNLKIFFGTGDSPYYDENINTDDTRYHFFAYRDESAKGQCNEDSVQLDWFLELPKGHRIFASAFAAAGNIYFGTATSETEDPCAPGSTQNTTGGTLFALTMGGSVVTQLTDVGSIITSPLVSDEHLYLRSQTLGLRSFGSSKYNNPSLAGGSAELQIKAWRELF
jgi:type IV pilus assembly protein PilY1